METVLSCCTQSERSSKRARSCDWPKHLRMAISPFTERSMSPSVAVAPLMHPVGTCEPSEWSLLVSIHRRALPPELSLSLTPMLTSLLMTPIVLHGSPSSISPSTPGKVVKRPLEIFRTSTAREDLPQGYSFDRVT